MAQLGLMANSRQVCTSMGVDHFVLLQTLLVSNGMNLILTLVSLYINVPKQKRLDKENPFQSSAQTYIHVYYMVNPS
jgi:hypothetical protein